MDPAVGRVPAGTPLHETRADLLRRALDTGLEWTILASWSRLGIAARRRLWGWGEPVAPGSLVGAQILVTGGTRGIGWATASGLVAAGASVGIVGRDMQRAQAAAAELRQLAPRTAGGAVWAAAADLGSLAAVRALVSQVTARTGRLDALVHAAGQLYRSYRRSPDGIERTAAVHVVGPHLLTAGLAPLLAVGAPSIVVWVSSGGMILQTLDVENLEMAPARFRGAVAYARAKRAQVELAHLWSAKLAGAGVSSVAMHPGWVDTDALRNGMPRFAKTLRPLLRSAAEGADTVVWLAGGAAGPHPRPALWFDRRLRPEHRRLRRGTLEAALLWAWCEQKTGDAAAALTAAPPTR